MLLILNRINYVTLFLLYWIWKPEALHVVKLLSWLKTQWRMFISLEFSKALQFSKWQYVYYTGTMLENIEWQSATLYFTCLIQPFHTAGSVFFPSTVYSSKLVYCTVLYQVRHFLCYFRLSISFKVPPWEHQHPELSPFRTSLRYFTRWTTFITYTRSLLMTLKINWDTGLMNSKLLNQSRSW